MVNKMSRSKPGRKTLTSAIKRFLLLNELYVECEIILVKKLCNELYEIAVSLKISTLKCELFDIKNYRR